MDFYRWSLFGILTVGVSFGMSAVGDDEIKELLEKMNGPAINKNLTGGKAGKQDENCDPKKAKTEKNPNSKVGKTIEYGNDANGNPVELTVLSPEQTQEYYDDMVLKNKSMLKLRNYDICVARAHKVALELEKKGVSSGKYFVNGGFVSQIDMRTPSLVPYFKNVKQHVSNFVLVEKENGQLEEMVIDAFLFPGGPVPKSELEKVFQGNRIYRSRAFNFKQSDMDPDGFFQFFKKEIPSRTKFQGKDSAHMNNQLEKAYAAREDRYTMTPQKRIEFLSQRCEELNDRRCFSYLEEMKKN